MNLPALDEVEVTVFGPGFGESIVVHYGNGEWIVIDSCVDSRSTQPAALQYLRALGADPSTCVKLILATHWHDDHVRGLSTMVQVCLNAAFACAAALEQGEFLKVMSVFNKTVTARDSGLSEIQKTFLILQGRGTSPRFASADRPLFGAPIRIAY